MIYKPVKGQQVTNSSRCHSGMPVLPHPQERSLTGKTVNGPLASKGRAGSVAVPVCHASTQAIVS